MQPGNTPNTVPWLSTPHDGTQGANTVAGDTGQNSLLVAGSRKEVSFSTTTAANLAQTEVSNYRWVAVQINSQGTSSSVTFQGSNDGTNWTSMTLADQTNSTNAAAISTSAASGKIWHGPISCRYFRIAVAGISAGTTAGVIEFFSAPGAMHSLGVVAVQSGTWTLQPGNTANTTPWLFTDRGTAATVSRVATSTSVATLQAANTSRKELIIANDSAGILYVKLGTAASATDYTYKLAAGATVIEAKYTGVVSGILDTGSGFAQSTEVA
jgi:hypothetical protein